MINWSNKNDRKIEIRPCILSSMIVSEAIFPYAKYLLHFFLFFTHSLFLTYTCWPQHAVITLLESWKLVRTIAWWLVQEWQASDTVAYHTPCDTFPSDRGCCCFALDALPALYYTRGLFGPHTKDFSHSSLISFPPLLSLSVSSFLLFTSPSHFSFFSHLAVFF